VAKNDTLHDTLDATPLDRTLEMRITALGDTVEVAHPRSTIEPARRAGLDGRAQVALAGLMSERHDARISVESTLGEGGMAIVHLAVQRSLGRKVAVKTLRPGQHSPQSAARLLREAWTTGAVEHPNVVPVHDVSVDAAGMPIIVLKRIEGRGWDTLMFDAAAVGDLRGARDLLEWNLRVLLAVCAALSAAHARGIVHRDVKPENVMIGAYGEVYLVDWGIAVSVAEDPSGRFMLAREATEMAGTPVYMAPEMLGGPDPRIDARTDVYLLGAVLFHVLAGRAPHDHENFRDVLKSVIASDCRPPAEAPEELAQVCRRAMHVSPDERYPSVDRFRHAIEEFLRHRGSLLLTAEADANVDELAALLGAADGAERARAYGRYGAARFGFLEALRAWPDNPVAHDKLVAAATRMVDYELSQGAPEAAEALLADLDTPLPELVARVALLKKEVLAKRARLEKLARIGESHDVAKGSRTRLVVTLIAGVLWTVSPIAVHSLVEGANAYANMRWFILAQVAVAFALGIWARESMTATVVNRQLLAAVMIMFAAVLAAQIGGQILRLPPSTIWLMYTLVWATMAALSLVLFGPRLLPQTLGYFAAFFVTAIHPEWRLYAITGANLLFTVNFALVWGALIPPEQILELRERASSAVHERRLR
jgi:eukaryotic-like serine/threonine-protein kinase